MRVLILREKREVGEDEVERGPPVSGGGGSERGRARAVDRAEGVGRWGWPGAEWPVGWLAWPGLARRARPWAELVSVQAGECVRVCYFLNRTLKWS